MPSTNAAGGLRLHRFVPSLVAACLLLGASLAQAADYTAAPGSTLGFQGAYQGEAFTGQFGKFTPVIRFDPAQLAQSRFDVRIELGSATTRNPDYDGELLGAGFLDSAGTPQARYQATKFRALGGNRFVADGQLTLRGITKPVALAFTWTPGARPVLEGDATVPRLVFNVGAGEWADVELIPDGIRVSTRLVLVPVPAKP